MKYPMRAFALGALVAVAALGCGGGQNEAGRVKTEGSATSDQALAHADAVSVTYYYLPG